MKAHQGMYGLNRRKRCGHRPFQQAGITFNGNVDQRA
jgi:hypothetical protein